MRQKRITEDSILPSVKSSPVVDLTRYTWLIYGRVKSGKTTLTACFPKCLHFMWEPGAQSISIFKVPKKKPSLQSWKEGLTVISRLEERNDEPDYQFRTASFDTGEKAWQACLKYMVGVLGAHPSEIKDYGASWEKVAQEFQSAHLRLINSGLGFVVIAHEMEKEMEDWDGKTYDRIQPKFSKNVSNFYEGIIDNIGYYHFVGRERMLQIRGDKSIVAGTRCDGHFLTPEGFEIWKEIKEISENLPTRRSRIKLVVLSRQLRRHQIIKIPMGYTPQNAYMNLVDAFNNKQKNIFNDDELIIKKGGRIHDMK
jgi:hypothetical protein